MDTSSNIIKINRDYADLINSLIPQDLSNLCINKDDGQIIELFRESVFLSKGIKIPSFYGELNSFCYKIYVIIEEIEKFWRNHTDSYIGSIKESPNFFVYAEKISQINQLGLFFDTVIVGHRVINIFGQKKELHKKIFESLFTIRDAMFLAPYLSATCDPPIVAIIPVPSFFSPDQPENMNIFIGNENLQYGLLADKNLTQYFNCCSKSFSGQNLKYWFDLFPGDKEIRVADVFDVVKLRKILNPFGPNYRSVLKEHNKREKKYGLSVLRMRFGTDATPINPNIRPPFEDLKNLLMNNSPKLYWYNLRELSMVPLNLLAQTARSDLISDSLQADPIIEDKSHYIFKSNLEAKWTKNTLKLDDEKFAARSLTSSRFKWLKNISDEDLIKIRCHGGIDQFRDLFRKYRKKIKYSSVGDFDKILENVESDFNKEILEYSKEIKKTANSRLQKIGISTLSFTATISLSIVSICFPPLSVVTIPSAIWSSLIGSASLKDLISNSCVENKKLSGLRQRPYATLLKYYPNIKTKKNQKKKKVE